MQGRVERVGWHLLRLGGSLESRLLWPCNRGTRWRGSWRLAGEPHQVRPTTASPRLCCLRGAGGGGRRATRQVSFSGLGSGRYSRIQCGQWLLAFTTRVCGLGVLVAVIDPFYPVLALLCGVSPPQCRRQRGTPAQGSKSKPRESRRPPLEGPNPTSCGPGQSQSQSQNKVAT